MKSKIEDPGNYRPFTLTSFPRNVMEQVIFLRILRTIKWWGVVCTDL